MIILLDACVPRPLKRILSTHSVSTAQDMGWGKMKNGELIKAAEQRFEVFVTCDQNIRYQQNIKERMIAILVIPTNDWMLIQKHAIEITDAVCLLKAGDFVELVW